MVNKEFFAALADLVKEKGISQESFIETLRNALASAYKKQYDNGADISVELDPEAGTIEFRATRRVVAEVTDRDKEISVEEAQELNPAYREGDEIIKTFVPKDFGRIAAQTAKQVILQKLHEAERDSTFSAFSDKEGELMEAVVRKTDERNVYVELGEKKIEGVMLPQDQSPTERYAVGDRLKVFVKRVKNSGKNSQILVSRAAPGLVRKLFEEQVPELAQGIVEIKGISREPGHRTKIAIHSTDARVDAVGACVGNRGSRVNAVVEELGGEKIDIIFWSENPLEFIAKALSPATVISVTQISEKGAVAVVPDDKLSLAIGRDGQNARLAARLTGWKIDVKSVSAAEKMNLHTEEEMPAEEEIAEQAAPEEASAAEASGEAEAAGTENGAGEAAAEPAEENKEGE
ncbi:MAG TPA: transcription termination/antitermination protein NusA [Candidatus Scatosoma pullistercoris]|uniref:Transcription termination/antitermination protein NusA n=1 Tax=Candidatus Scatosoma pullistercoris TaxID=2840934 RepID=A0A9D1MGE7_9FIRM|nr:transcription termination/antitermination protein NusA [Candidatus Scatosoma pullistercoris]